MSDPLLDALKTEPSPVATRAPVPEGLWKKFTYYYAWLLEFLLASCVAILIVPVTLQVMSRYTPLIPNYIWTEELARFLFVWTIMIGAMVGVREATHFDVDLLPVLSRKREAVVRIIARLGILALSLVFVWSGVEFTKFAWNRTSELGDLPLWFIHIAWPIAGVTWIVFAGEQIVDEMKVIFSKTNGEGKGA
jgi:TRAP-type C4-dicarboxylate transport system permease small subunit